MHYALEVTDLVQIVFPIVFEHLLFVDHKQKIIVLSVIGKNDRFDTHANTGEQNFVCATSRSPDNLPIHSNTTC